MLVQYKKTKEQEVKDRAALSVPTSKNKDIVGSSSSTSADSTAMTQRRLVLSNDERNENNDGNNTCHDLVQKWKNSESFASSTSSQRIVNYEESGITHEMAKQMISNNLIDHMDPILGQTICHSQGRFRSTQSSITLNAHEETTPNGYWNITNESLVYDWEFRLIYLAIHSFMHQPAYEEYIERKEACGDDGMREIFPPYDYQCKDAKFVVTALPGEGLGATIRSSGVMHMLAGLATDRIPLYVANLPPLDAENKTFLEQPWNLASCPRKDLQCVFLPTTPCTLTMEDWKNAVVVDGREARDMKRGGYISPTQENVRVLIYVPKSIGAIADTFKGNHDKVRQRLHQEAKKIIHQLETSYPNLRQDQRHVLHYAAKKILESDLPDSYEHYAYGHR